MGPGPASPHEERESICRSLGFSGLGEAHALVASAAPKDSGKLLSRGLTGKKLIALGYSLSAMERLGFERETLGRMGYPIPRPAAAPAQDSGEEGDGGDPTAAAQAREAIAKGVRASELKGRGFTIQHCRSAGYSAAELAQIGFTLDDMRGSFSIQDLKRAGFGGSDLKRLFSGTELKRGGLTAVEMKVAGFGVGDLLGFGYPANHIIAAGYSVAELTRHGLSPHTSDKRGMKGRG